MSRFDDFVEGGGGGRNGALLTLPDQGFVGGDAGVYGHRDNEEVRSLPLAKLKGRINHTIHTQFQLQNKIIYRLFVVVVFISIVFELIQFL